MDELSRKFRSIDWKGLQKSARKMQASTASALKDMVMTDMENKVRAATSDNSWGASGSDLMQIAQGTFNREDYALIMSIVWQRLGSSRWRCVYKGLEVLRYLIMHGAARCVEEARAAAHHIQTLQHYRHVDPKTRRDCGEGVRARAKLVCDMLADEAILEEEREKSRELRSKLQGGISVGPGGRLGGLSSDDYQYGLGGGSEGNGTGFATTATGNIGTFKGYGDEDGNGSYTYDDAPTGTFAQRATGQTTSNIKVADAPDLLGDEPVYDSQNGNGAAHVGDEDEDDDFDPRADNKGGVQNVQSSITGGSDNLFGMLEMGGSATEEQPAHLAITDASTAAGTSAMPTSMLIQNLARQKQEQQEPVPNIAQQSGNAMNQQAQGIDANLNPSTAASDGPQHATLDFGFGAKPEENVPSPNPFVNAASSGETKRPQKPLVTSKPDTDPFGDLLDSAKKSGVL